LFGSKHSHHPFSLHDKVESDRELKVNAGPSCPIRFGTGNNSKEALADQCLTAAEIEWRRWSGWQMERTAEKQFRKRWI